MKQVDIPHESEAGDTGNKIGLRVVIALRVRGGEVDGTGEKKTHSGDRFRVQFRSSF
jgi:hypothetical protein